jgi:hypothetical protein
MVVMALLESVCAATERPWHALCADPISGLGSENSKSVEGSKSMNVQCPFFSCIQTPNRSFSVQTTILPAADPGCCPRCPLYGEGRREGEKGEREGDKAR